MGPAAVIAVPLGAVALWYFSAGTAFDKQRPAAKPLSEFAESVRACTLSYMEASGAKVTPENSPSGKIGITMNFEFPNGVRGRTMFAQDGNVDVRNENTITEIGLLRKVKELDTYAASDSIRTAALGCRKSVISADPG